MNNQQGPAARPERLTDLIRRLLDRGYTRATDQVIRAIVRDATTGIIAQRLAELDEEARRLAALNRALLPSNPVVRALLTDLEDTLRNDARRIADAAEDLQRIGVQAAADLTRRLALPNVPDDQLRTVLGVSWNTPSEEAVGSAVNYTSMGTWGDELRNYGPTVQTTVRNQAVRGIAEGWGPVRTAREIRRTAQSLPAHQANNLMRTLQLQSYRTGSAVNMAANSDILDGHMRIAALDDRCCMACIALHGTVLPVGERVDDHHQGRCTTIPLVTGRSRRIQTGPEWFESLPPERQLIIAGPGKLDALNRGDIRWQDLPAAYDDPTFGRMIREAALRDVL